VISPKAEIPYADFVLEAWIASDPASGGGSATAIPTIRPGLNLWASPRLGDPEDIAAMVAFLFSDDGAYVNGQTILVDGGAHLT
jgi:NAD(P)-dependent dehydrogenase (short-subunit alcohol dehydrogenase family)